MTIETFASHTDGGFILDFQSPELADVQRLFHIDTGRYGRSYARSGPFDRPQWEFKSDLNYFLSNLLGGDHSLKTGVRWRDTPFGSGFHVGGFVTSRVRNTGVPCSSRAARCEADLHRDSNASDLLVQRNEVFTGRDDLITWSSIYDPDDPAALSTPNTVDPDLKNDRTREFIAGIDHELMANFAVGANYIWRKYDRFTYNERFGLSTADYQPRTATDRCGNDSCEREVYEYTYYVLPFRLPAESVLTNDPYDRDFNGVEVTARKRFNQRWLLNGSLSVGSTIAHYPEGRQQDPTNIPFFDGQQENSRNARWIAKLSGMYAFPLGINASFFLNARQGFPYSRNVLSPTRPNGLGAISVRTEPYGTSRYDNMVMVDARVEKGFQVKATRLTVSLDVFNATNTDTVLDRFNRQDSSRANNVQEVIVGRVLRLGLRMKF